MLAEFTFLGRPNPEPIHEEDCAMQAPDHCDEVIRLIDDVLGDLSAGHDASLRPSVHIPANGPVVETHVRADSSIVCRPSGGLDWIGAVSLRHAINDSVRPGAHIIIDLSRVDFIDAVGMSALVGSVRRVRAVGGEAHISNPSSHVRRGLELVGVYSLLTYSSARNGNDVA
jgi:anti-anti-sigma factor